MASEHSKLNEYSDIISKHYIHVEGRQWCSIIAL